MDLIFIFYLYILFACLFDFFGAWVHLLYVFFSSFSSGKRFRGIGITHHCFFLSFFFLLRFVYFPFLLLLLFLCNIFRKPKTDSVGNLRIKGTWFGFLVRGLSYGSRMLVCF